VTWVLNKFKHWILGANFINNYSDHNPLAYLTDTTPKSSKLIRWSLAQQEYVCFKYRAARLNGTPDSLSRMVSSAEDCQSVTGEAVSPVPDCSSSAVIYNVFLLLLVRGEL
jgi:RNase H-like domain found in reverse transcriptase